MIDANALSCPDEAIASLLAMVAEDETGGSRELALLLGKFPKDARLHFLDGSLRAGRQDYDGARAAMRRAVDLAPDYAIARFQLGFLLLTCGEPHAAQEAWGPLHGSGAEHYLRDFVAGLTHLIHDRFAEAMASLQKGIAANGDNPALNSDMQMIVDETRRQSIGQNTDEPMSSAQMLLHQASLKGTRH